MTRGKQETDEKISKLFGSLDGNKVKDKPSVTNNDKEIAALEGELADVNAQLQEYKQTAIVPAGDKGFAFRNFRLVKTGLRVAANTEITEDDANALGHALKKVEGAVQFWMGDWANLYLEDNMSDNQRSEVYKSLSDKFEIELRTLQQYASVCRILAPSRRRETLSYSHHQEVAFLPEILKGQEDDFLDTAIENKWSVRDLREAIQKAATPPKPKPVPKPATIFDTKPIFKQFRQVSQLLGKDEAELSGLSQKKRDEYRGKVATLRRTLDEIEAKLDT